MTLEGLYSGDFGTWSCLCKYALWIHTGNPNNNVYILVFHDQTWIKTMFHQWFQCILQYSILISAVFWEIINIKGDFWGFRWIWGDFGNYGDFGISTTRALSQSDWLGLLHRSPLWRFFWWYHTLDDAETASSTSLPCCKRFALRQENCLHSPCISLNGSCNFSSVIKFINVFLALTLLFFIISFLFLLIITYDMCFNK